MKITKTNRNFDIIDFTDSYGTECSLQKSSLAFEDRIWLGTNDGKPQIQTPEGFKPYTLPDKVLLSTRMHLTRKQVKQLLPFLKKFAKTGELS